MTEQVTPIKKSKSKTIKYNSLWFAIASAMLVVFAENQELIKEYIPDWGYLIVIMFNSGMGIYLRTITTAPIEKRK